MKSLIKAKHLYLGLLFMNNLFYAQTDTAPLKTTTMDTSQNKAAYKESIRNLYENILNARKLEQLKGLISEEYTNTQGGKGLEAFQKQILELIKSFPDVQWKVERMVAEGNKVVVWQKVQGTHTGQFHNIAPTGKAFVNTGIAFYEFKDGKIIYSHVQTDRLSFLQQLGVLPTDLSALLNTAVHGDHVYLVDRFLVPKASIGPFKQRMNYTKDYVKTLPGFVKYEVMEQKDREGNATIMTVATWANQAKLDQAKLLVQEEFKKNDFEPDTFYKKLHIKAERSIYISVAP